MHIFCAPLNENSGSAPDAPFNVYIDVRAAKVIAS